MMIIGVIIIRVSSKLLGSIRNRGVRKTASPRRRGRAVLPRLKERNPGSACGHGSQRACALV